MKTFNLNGTEYKLTGSLYAAIIYREANPQYQLSDLRLTRINEVSSFMKISFETYDFLTKIVKSEYPESFL